MSFETAKNDRQPRGASARIAGGLLGSTLFVLGASGILSSQAATADAAPTTPAGDDGEMTRVDETAGQYTRVADVQGTFAFNQDGVSPNDELFNIFGTTLTSMCSKPNPELIATEGGVANYYVNVGGDIKKTFTADVRELSKESSVQTLMACSCATGAALGQAMVMGVPLSAVVEMADLDEGVNTVTAYGTDGFGTPIPLRYALDHNALLVYQVNGEDIEEAAGTSLQLWIPETVARYFTRNIVDIEFTARDAEPEVLEVSPEYRNKVNIMNHSDGCVFVTGNEITFSGVADDLGSPIDAIEFSFDGGETWTVCETAGATADKWVNWDFTTSFDEAGDYRMTVRARTADGVVSPLEATLTFQVIEA